MHPAPLPVAEACLSLPDFLARLADLIEAQDAQGALALLTGEPELARQHPVAANSLGYLLLQAERPGEAEPWFRAALALKPDYAAAFAGLGMAMIGTGATTAALPMFEKAVTLNPEDASSWYHRGALLADRGQAALAEMSLEQALRLNPDYHLALLKKGHLYEAAGRFNEAVQLSARALQLAPDDAACWTLFGDIMQKLGRLDQAIEAYDQGLSLSAGDFYCLCNKAQALEKQGHGPQALALARQALAKRPDNIDALLLTGNLERDHGDRQAARACFLKAASQGPARHYRAISGEASVKALMLFAPFAGNTPYEDLVEGANFDADLLIALPEARYDTAGIGEDADVVVNLVSDLDLSSDVLASVEVLAESFGRPIINHPARIFGTDRASIARRLQDVSHAVMPMTRRIEAAELKEAAESLALPVILRHAGTHGGDRMELLDTADAVKAFAEEAADASLYLTDYVDYASADGFFRKYRWVFVGEEILPYHLAIGDGWKVHHAATRMKDEAWMRDEELDFLNNPGRYFSADAMAALDEIRRRIGLDYFGIDCGLDRQGRVVVFEVNASMLVHERNFGFEYKNPHVRRIKQAFEGLLRRKAGMEV
ncbi:tetratricopeptide repeat protein [Allorhizobium undicola]|uniref:tetratricopeptide repeat protein n=1 Tax=Allorhizobium undicola TaxID=78527 RepID=UPI0004801A2C|nr:tetratricopeptide repeat protein [Allorhizobium undicola]